MTNNFTRTQARSAILSYIVPMVKDMVESVPNLKSKDVGVYYENQPKPDLDKHKYVVEVTIEFDSSEQADISPDPTIRVSGYVSFVIGVREGGGTIITLTFADYIHQHFRWLWLEKVRVMNPREVGTYSLSAWNFRRIDVPFRFDAKDFNTP